MSYGKAWPGLVMVWTGLATAWYGLAKAWPGTMGPELGLACGTHLRQPMCPRANHVSTKPGQALARPSHTNVVITRPGHVKTKPGHSAA